MNTASDSKPPVAKAASRCSGLARGAEGNDITNQPVRVQTTKL
jgi:hypothetical protein